MTAIKTIYACRRAAGLDDEAARDVYHRVTGKRSLKLMSSGEQDQVAAEFKRLAGTPQRRPDGRRKLDGKFAAKLQALWIACWNLGIVQERDDAALMKFIKRQSKVDDARWLWDGLDAAKTIEALKSMLDRAGVDWNAGSHLTAHERLAGYKIARAQIQTLNPDIADNAMLVGRALALVTEQLAGRQPFEIRRECDWIPIMNELGKRVRAKGGKDGE